jgi:chromosome segregation ATPase
MFTRWLLGVAAITMAIVGALGAAASAQATRATNPDGLDQLLSEVRGLRAEVTQAAGASMRMQLLLARLSLQEQRIAALNRQSLELQRQLTNLSRDRGTNTDHLQRLTTALESTAIPASERSQVDFEVSFLKTRIAEQEEEEQRLQAQAYDVANVIAAEQGRWLDFNSRLDELERSLPASTR